MRQLDLNKTTAFIHGAAAGILFSGSEVNSSLKYISQATLIPATIAAEDSYYDNMMSSYFKTTLLIETVKVCVNPFQILSSIASVFIPPMINRGVRAVLTHVEDKPLPDLEFNYEEYQTPDIIEVPIYYEVPVLGYGDSIYNINNNY